MLLKIILISDIHVLSLILGSVSLLSSTAHMVYYILAILFLIF